MPTSFRIDLDHGVMIAKSDGIIGAADLIAAADAGTSHADYRPEMNILWNIQGARLLIELEEAKDVAEYLSKLGARGTPHRVAYVVGDDLTAMLTGLFPRIGPEHVVDYQTFEDLAEALEWLGLPPGYEL